MPIIKSAIKKMRKDKRRTKFNRLFRLRLKTAIKKAKEEKNKTTVTCAISLLDKAVKRHILPKNTGSRIKSRLSLLLQSVQNVAKKGTKKQGQSI